MWSEECGERSAVALAAEIAASARVEKRRFLENISVGCLLETQDMWCGSEEMAWWWLLERDVGCVGGSLEMQGACVGHWRCRLVCWK